MASEQLPEIDRLIRECGEDLHRNPPHIPGNCPSSPVGLVEPARGDVLLVPDRRLRDRVDELRAWAKSRIEAYDQLPAVRKPYGAFYERRTLEAVLRILDGGEDDGG